MAYSRDYGDGTTGNDDEASHTYAAEGTYAVTLEVTDDGGKTAAAQKGHSVLPPETLLPDPPESGGACG